MKVFELYNFFEENIPKCYSCEWDNDGLMCSSDLNAEVGKVLFTLDVTLAALKYAADNGFNTIISHHPLIFRPLGSVTPENHISQKVLFAIKNNINVFSFHTRFDAMPDGINDLLADKLGLCDVVPFGDSDMGRIGYLKSKTNFEEFCSNVKLILGCDKICCTKSKDTVNKVAVLGGAGKDFIKAAKYAGADALVSGELGYNNMIEAAEFGISLIEAGHFFTEDIAYKYFSELLNKLDLEIEYFSSYNIITI